MYELKQGTKWFLGVAALVAARLAIGLFVVGCATCLVVAIIGLQTGFFTR
jgi:hypothetical protein